MPDSSKNRQEISSGYWLRQTLQNGIPADCIYPYRKLLNLLIAHYKDLIDSVITEESRGRVVFPIEPFLIERYLDGFTFDYMPFNTWLDASGHKDGFWETDPKDPSHILIHYNQAAPICRQRFTKIHELFHFIQTIDVKLLNFFDELILNTNLPPIVIDRLLERGTEKAAAMYLMPNKYFRQKYIEIAQKETQKKKILEQLAKYFEVSISSANFRLGECGIYLPSYS